MRKMAIGTSVMKKNSIDPRRCDGNRCDRGEGVGEVKYTNVYETFGPDTLSQEVSEALNHSVTGTLGPPCEPGAPGETSAPFDYGPLDLYGNPFDPGKDNGCGCASTRRPAAEPLLLLLVLAFLARRRQDSTGAARRSVAGAHGG